MTRSFRRSLGIGAALAFLVLGSPVDGAAADSHEASSAEGFGDDPLANPGLQRSAEVPAEPTGPPARSAARGIVNCGEVITKNTTLLRDVGPCPGNGIIIGADNIILNLNGHTVSGTPGPSDDGNQAGIRLPNRSGVTVTGLPGGSGKKGTVTGFDGGVVVAYGSGNTIENLTVRDNNGRPDRHTFLGDGILILRSSNNHVRNNDVLRNGIWDGIGVWGTGANGNTIEENLVEDTTGLPITDPNQAPDVVYGGEGIKAMWALSGMEVRRGPAIVNNRVANNISRRNDATGISLYGSEQSAVTDNTVEDNGQAWFASEYPYKYSFNARRFISQGNGIEVITRTWHTEVLVDGNSSFRNFRHGIYVYGFDNRILDNNTGYNTVYDLVDALGFGSECPNVWFGNTWGPLSDYAAQWDYPSMAIPECTRAGGSGPVSSGG